MKVQIEKSKDAGIDAALIAASLIAAKFVMDFASTKLPNPKMVPLVGLAGALPYVLNIGGKEAKSVGAGFLAAGLLQGAKSFTEGKTGFLATVNDALPSLSGFSGYNGFYGLSDSPDFNLLNGPGGPMVADERVLLM